MISLWNILKTITQEDNTYTYEFTGWTPNIEENVTRNIEYVATYEAREKENMKADIERNKAYNDYIAMMCDVELPEPEENKIKEELE